jgi:hypothetical protein
MDVGALLTGAVTGALRDEEMDGHLFLTVTVMACDEVHEPGPPKGA